MNHNQSFGLSGTQVWPTMLFTRRWEHHLQEAPSIIAFLEQLKSTQREPIESQVAIGAKSARGLYESDFDLFSRPHSGLQRLERFIENTLMLAISVANQQESKPQDIQIKLVDSWYHITNEGGFHDAHVHHGCSWCGIYYLHTGDFGKNEGQSAPNGGSRFYCPLQVGGGYRDYGNKYLTAAIDPPIENGLLLLFPSYLMHSGLPYVGSEDRIVIAFNAQAFLKFNAPTGSSLT